ncbi:hypothetical protein EV359DRAFT_81546 [Lentinula novae-zelandiae]|nr:hypothetical protein EV359DRAFT_81546 [Lentinula novae-zelandiae]
MSFDCDASASIGSESDSAEETLSSSHTRYTLLPNPVSTTVDPELAGLAGGVLGKLFSSSLVFLYHHIIPIATPSFHTRSKSIAQRNSFVITISCALNLPTAVFLIHSNQPLSSIFVISLYYHSFIASSLVLKQMASFFLPPGSSFVKTIAALFQGQLKVEAKVPIT